MAVTTFADLITRTSSRKVFLVEIEPSELLTDWVLYSGSIYYVEVGRYHVLAVNEDGVALTETTSIAGVTAGKWFYDSSTARLYVRASSGSIFAKVMVADYRLYFCSNLETAGAGVVFNDRFYEPLVATTPSLRQKKSDLFWGVSIVSDGSVSLVNHDGYFDDIYHRFAWNNKDVTILLGGEDLPYSEYAGMFSGRVFDKTFGTMLFDLAFVDRKYDLTDSLVVNEFDRDTYPYIESEFIGRPVPIVYGTVYRMPAVCVDGLQSTATTFSFKFADTSLGSVFALSQVYVNGNAVAHTSPSLGAATFKLSQSVFEVGDLVSVDCQGYTSGGDLVENPVEVLKAILAARGIAYTSANYDTTAVAEAVTDAEVFPIGLAIVDLVPVLDIVQDIMRSCMGTLFVDNDGLLSVNIWDTDIPDSLTLVTEVDMLPKTFKARARLDNVKKVSRVGWQKNWETGEYRYDQESSTTTERVYGLTKSRTIPTLLSTQVGVDVYKGRMVIMLENETTEMRFTSKLLLAGHNIGDRMTVSFRRRASDDNLSWVDERVVEIQEIDKDFDNNTIAVLVDDLKGIGGNVGHWTEDSPTFPSTLGGGAMSPWDADWSPAQKAYAKAHAGYWCDADGLADSSDADSRRISRWW